jgi:hypothetical protein
MVDRVLVSICHDVVCIMDMEERNDGYLAPITRERVVKWYQFHRGKSGYQPPAKSSNSMILRAVGGVFLDRPPASFDRPLAS